jgi:hypothetical protein
MDFAIFSLYRESVRGQQFDAAFLLKAPTKVEDDLRPLASRTSSAIDHVASRNSFQPVAVVLCTRKTMRCLSGPATPTHERILLCSASSNSFMASLLSRFERIPLPTLTRAGGFD